jgi:hypothetical protein
MALFFKKGITHKISVLEEKQEGGSVLHMTNALTVRIPAPVLVILEDGPATILHITEDP